MSQQMFTLRRFKKSGGVGYCLEQGCRTQYLDKTAFEKIYDAHCGAEHKGDTYNFVDTLPPTAAAAPMVVITPKHNPVYVIKQEVSKIVDDWRDVASHKAKYRPQLRTLCNQHKNNQSDYITAVNEVVSSALGHDVNFVKVTPFGVIHDYVALAAACQPQPVETASKIPTMKQKAAPEPQEPADFMTIMEVVGEEQASYYD